MSARTRAPSGRSTHRSIFREALAWLEIHGDAPEIVEHWNALLAEGPASRPTRRPPPQRPRPKTVRRAADAGAAGGGAAAVSVRTVASGLQAGRRPRPAEAGATTRLRTFPRWSCTAWRGRSAISSLMIGHAGSISLGREAELRAARVAVMVVVQAFAAGQQREEAEVGRGVVEVPVADVMAQAVDRRRQHEHVHHRVNAGGEQPPPEPDDQAQQERCRSSGRASRA